MLKIERHPTGPRLYALGLRIHHGLTGTPALVTAGALLVADDLHDFPWNPRERAATAPAQHRSHEQCYANSTIARLTAATSR